MKMSGVLFLALFLSSCIPISIKPEIIDYSITNGAKFKRGIPNQEVFVFEDPKEVAEFYKYINVKFNRQHQDVEYNVPVVVADATYFMTFYEAERSAKTINLLPMASDALLGSNNITPW